MFSKEKLYFALLEGFGKAYPSKTKREVQDSVVQIWKELKVRVKNVTALELDTLVHERLLAYKAKENANKSLALTFWGTVPKVPSSKAFEMNTAAEKTKKKTKVSKIWKKSWKIR
jgi:hypothetical protein